MTIGIKLNLRFVGKSTRMLSVFNSILLVSAFDSNIR